MLFWHWLCAVLDFTITKRKKQGRAGAVVAVPAAHRSKIVEALKSKVRGAALCMNQEKTI